MQNRFRRQKNGPKPLGDVTDSAEHGSITLAAGKIDLRRWFFIVLGLSLFLIIYFSSAWPDAVDPQGKHFVLTREGKAALGLLVMAVIWWVFEVIPIGVTSITIGVIQALFMIRDAKVAFSDFLDPSVWFILGSLVIGLAFTRTGLAGRAAYKMLTLVGEKTSMIYLGCFTLTAGLTLIMAHTAVAAAVFPVLMVVYRLYEKGERPTRFGKGLFIGMAFTAGAGSIITLLGSARAAVAVGFFRDMVGREISFFELSYYMFPLGAMMVILIWVLILLLLKPERKTLPGLRQRALALAADLGPITKAEISTLVIVFAAVGVMCLRSFIPALEPLNKTALILITTILFFLFRILTLKDLEDIPWNIVLLFGGSMSIGFCLWQTGAAEWVAIEWLGMFTDAHWFIFIMGVALLILVITNFIMNVAAIAITLPVALVMARYLHVAPEIIFFASLVAAGMPFLLLIGTAPNAMAYESRQFSAWEFFLYGIPATVVLVLVLALFVGFVWPLMGMPTTL